MGEDDVAVEQVVVVRPEGDPRKGYYGPDVELLLMADRTVRWRYEGEDEV